MYLPEDTTGKFIAAAKLRKIVNTGERKRNVVRLYQPFWNKEMPPLTEHAAGTEINDVAHPIIVYADLLATGDSRNLETARIIYDDYIAKHIRED